MQLDALVVLWLVIAGGREQEIGVHGPPYAILLLVRDIPRIVSIGAKVILWHHSKPYLIWYALWMHDRAAS